MATSVSATWHGAVFGHERTAHHPYAPLSAANANEAAAGLVVLNRATGDRSPYQAAGLYERHGVSWPAWTAAVLLHGALALTAVAIGWTSHPPMPALPETIAVVFENAPPAPMAAPAQPAVPPPQTSAPREAAPAPPPPPAAAQVKPLEPAPSAVALLPPPPPVRPRPAIAVAPAPKPTIAPEPVAPAALQPAPAPQSAPAAPTTVAAAPVIPPRPASGVAGNRKPVYPLAARSRHLEGRVMLEVQVAASGDPLAVRVVSSSGHSLLDTSAVDAVRTWRFIPATRAGQAVAASVEVPIDFRMAD